MKAHPGNARSRNEPCEDNQIDSEGFRANVGMVLLNDRGQVFWGRRMGVSGWQFPQGGIRPSESPQQAMFRELNEEVGLTPEQVEVLGCTSDWLRYRLPDRYIRRHQRPLCIGQKQVWFALRLVAEDCAVCLDHGDIPEFQEWRWVDYWKPAQEVIRFKRDVYRLALNELAEYVTEHPSLNIPRRPRNL